MGIPNHQATRRVGEWGQPPQGESTAKKALGEIRREKNRNYAILGVFVGI